MEEEACPVRQQQRRLNPTILDVVKKEVTKLLAVGIIYLISDSNWVSLVQVVPKKSRMIMMKNQNDELVPMRTKSWRSWPGSPTIAFWTDILDTCKYTSRLKIHTRQPSPVLDNHSLLARSRVALDKDWSDMVSADTYPTWSRPSADKCERVGLTLSRTKTKEIRGFEVLNNQVRSGPFTPVIVCINLQFSYDNRQMFIHCHTEELCDRYLIR
ncbi:hypothetical protein CR513_28366, partial [Mucuna pruriens]